MNNGSNNGYCGHRLRQRKNVPTIITEAIYFFLSGFFPQTFTIPTTTTGEVGGYLFTPYGGKNFWAKNLWGGYCRWKG